MLAFLEIRDVLLPSIARLPNTAARRNFSNRSATKAFAPKHSHFTAGGAMQAIGSAVQIGTTTPFQTRQRAGSVQAGCKLSSPLYALKQAKDRSQCRAQPEYAGTHPRSCAVDYKSILCGLAVFE